MICCWLTCFCVCVCEVGEGGGERREEGVKGGKTTTTKGHLQMKRRLALRGGGGKPALNTHTHTHTHRAVQVKQEKLFLFSFSNRLIKTGKREGRERGKIAGPCVGEILFPVQQHRQLLALASSRLATPQQLREGSSTYLTVCPSLFHFFFSVPR